MGPGKGNYPARVTVMILLNRLVRMKTDLESNFFESMPPMSII